MTDPHKERTTVLLGAGASVDAGIPASVNLTKKIVETIDTAQTRYHGTAQALNIAIGAMIAHDTAKGGDAFAGIDVERIFAAIRMLATRDDLDIAPYVAAWNPHLDGLGRKNELPAFWEEKFVKALASERRHNGQLKAAFKEGVASLTGKRDENVFADLEQQMINALKEALHVDAQNVDYLAPLLYESSANINIATLNYDRSIELLAGRANASLDTGVGSWSGGYDWKWDESAHVRLLKLHGSLDWYLERTKSAESRMAEDKIVVWPSDGPERPSRNSSLAVVFGQGVKLRSDGPFLAMLQEFDHFLTSTDRLVIVGYSMRDDHINAAIRRWINSAHDPKLSIIDPYPPDFTGYNNQRHSFYVEVLKIMHEFDSSTRQHRLKSGHQLIRTFAADGLHEIFGPGPELKPVIPPADDTQVVASETPVIPAFSVG